MYLIRGCDLIRYDSLLSGVGVCYCSRSCTLFVYDRSLMDGFDDFFDVLKFCYGKISNVDLIKSGDDSSIDLSERRAIPVEDSLVILGRISVEEGSCYLGSAHIYDMVRVYRFRDFDNYKTITFSYINNMEDFMLLLRREVDCIDLIEFDLLLDENNAYLGMRHRGEVLNIGDISHIVIRD